MKEARQQGIILNTEISYKSLRPPLKPRRYRLFNAGWSFYMAALVGAVLMLAFWALDPFFYGWYINSCKESGIFVKPVSYRYVMTEYRNEGLLLVKVVPAMFNPSDEQGSQIIRASFFVDGKSYSYKDLESVVEVYEDTSVAKTAIIVLDQYSANRITHGELTMLIDMLKTKRCRRIGVTSPTFRWEEPY